MSAETEVSNVISDQIGKEYYVQTLKGMECPLWLLIGLCYMHILLKVDKDLKVVFLADKDPNSLELMNHTLQ